MGVRSFLLFMAGLGFVTCALGQSWKSLSADDLFHLARQEAYQGQWPSAKEKAIHLLSTGKNSDVTLLYGLILSWEGDLRGAEKVLDGLFNDDRGNVDAALALCNVHVWRSDRLAALRILDLALESRPRHAGLLYAKAKLLDDLERFNEAQDVLKLVLADSASHPAAQALLIAMKEKNRRFSAGITYQSDFFNRFYEPARLMSAQLSYQSKAGTFIGRVNHADRFNLSGLQYEADLYPKLSNRFYAYLNFGHSGSVLFPQSRFGAEVFMSLPQAFEISGGWRFMHFAEARSISVYTATVGKYHDRLYLSLRGFLSHHPDAPPTFSGSLLGKYFIGEKSDFVLATATMGFAPDNVAVQNGISLTGTSAAVLNYHAGLLGYERAFLPRWICNVSAEVSRQGSFFSEDGHLWMTSLRVNVRRKF